MHSTATATPASLEKQEISQLSINTIRTLAMDGVEAAKSGHPGTPMALAPVAYSLWNEVLRYDPADPLWPSRDRFILSCGHASMLLYATLHLAGVKQVEHGKVTDELAVPLEHIRHFRQLGYRTPGHPESRETSGVETTTGPLGQGVGNSVGMAIAQRWLASHFNRPGFDIFDYRIYTLCSDGDLMEGVSNEAASIAGHLQLSNLCWIYDDNHITIEGNTELAYSDEVATRFTGLGWHVVRVEDANDLPALRRAYSEFHSTTGKPTIVIVRSHIGYGAPHKQDTAKAHGEALGEEEIRLTKKFYGWPEDAKFLVPESVTAHFAAGIGARGAKLRTAWEQKFKQYAAKYPDLAAEWQQMVDRELPDGWDSTIPTYPTDAKGVSSRISSGKVLNALAEQVPSLIGGAADLSPSTMTHLTFDSAGDFEPGNYAGRNFHFGIREHGMGAAVNGMALSHVRPYGSTFFVFTDYMRPSIRLSAIMRIPSIWIFTHDSIGVGEDGPTHQPIEHLAACRAIPDLIVLRPGDANEVAESWRVIMPLKDHPVCLVLTRQNLPTLDRTKYAPAAGVAKGAYILADAEGGKPELILIGTGSELSVCVEAYEKLKAEGIKARVVSMPSWELFEQQDAAYREKVFPTGVTRRIAVEAAERFGWDRYIGATGRFVGMKGYGASAPGPVLFKHFGIDAEHVIAQARELMGKKG
jgi:transketolase